MIIPDRADLAALAELVSDATFVADETGTILFANAPLWRLVAPYPEDRTVDWNEIFELGFTHVYNIINDKPDADYQFISRLAARDSETLYCEVVCRARRRDNGELTGIIGTVRPIVADDADRKEGERRFEELCEVAPIAMYRAAADGRITYVNGAWAAKVGLTSAQAMGHGWMAALAETSRYVADPPWQGFTPERPFKTRLSLFRGKDGDTIEFEILNHAEFDPDGNVSGFVGAMVDVTEKQRTRARLRKREEQLALLATHSTDAILRLDLTGVCLYASPAAQELLQVPPAALIGHQVLVSLHLDDDATLREAMASLAGGHCDDLVAEWRTDWRRAPGDYFWIEGSCRLVRDEAGAPREIVASLRKIDERKQLEAKLEAARAVAEAASRAQAMFIANMSHEIRTPMNGVIGAADLLLASELQPSQRRLAEMLVQSGETMVAMLNDVLDLSRYGSPALELAREPLSLRALLTEVADAQRPLLRDKPVELHVSISTRVPQTIIGDALRLRQIVGNLLSNAVKFTSQGTIDVRLSCTGGDRLRLEVADTGAGFHQTRARAIFEPFVQADEGVHRQFGGTGLGLAIVSEIVRTMRGSITAKGQLGRGSVFVVELPLERASVSRKRTTGSPDPTSVGRYSGRVLVAEDHPINQAIISAMLDKLGVSHVVVADGQMAVAMLAQPGQVFDLVLMDLEMPVLDGAASAASIRQLNGVPSSLPIIALTAHAGEKVTEAMNDGNFQDFLAKPLTLDDLEATVRSYLPTHQA